MMNYDGIRRRGEARSRYRDIIHVKPTPSIFRLDHSLQPRVASLNLAATGRARTSIYIRI